MSILQRLSEIHELPTLPEIAFRIQALISSDEGDASMLARIIEQDPSLSAKLLKIANSSFYSSSANKITSVKVAITRIGFNEVGNIVLAVSLVRSFSKNSNILDYRLFWRHSLSSAFLTRMTAQASGIEFTAREQQGYFLSGLLHDIGILIYDQFFHDQFEEIIDYALVKEISYLDAERAIVPLETHNVIGCALLELWKLDIPIVSSIRYHHNPEKAPDQFRPISMATYLSEYILCNTNLGSFEGLITNGNKNILNTLQMTPDMMTGYMRLVEYEVEKSELVLALEADCSVFQLRGV
jgi:HD-like signal output (HDOD) protein